MTPAARAAAAIELLDAIVAAAREGGAAADTLIARYFADRRYAGSKDRRAVRELVYAAIRRAGELPESGRAALVGLAREQPEVAEWFDGSARGPAPIAADEPGSAAGVAPAWLETKLAATLGRGDLPPLLERAPLDLRVNRLKVSREDVLPRLAGAVPTPHAPDGLRLPEALRIEGEPVWREGLVVIQDEGSQIVGIAAGAQPGMTVVDLCAGAGGKTLALAAAMRNEGRLIACDVDRARLSRLSPRAERAGVSTVEQRLLDGNREAEALADLRGAANVVLVDAPCSGVGTWRRNPEARWRLTPARLQRLVELQARLLDLAATLVRPGGALAYITCSLLDEEGSAQVERFLARTREWSAEPLQLPAGRKHGPGVRLTPAHDGTDGFFVARLVRAC